MARRRQGSPQKAQATSEFATDHEGGAINIPAAEFKAQCLALLERVRQSRRPIVVTKHGRPIAKVVPLRKQARSILGFSKGTVRILGDIVAPTGERWEADAD